MLLFLFGRCTVVTKKLIIVTFLYIHTSFPVLSLYPQVHGVYVYLLATGFINASFFPDLFGLVREDKRVRVCVPLLLLIVCVCNTSFSSLNTTQVQIYRGLHFFYVPKTGAVCMLFASQKKCQVDRLELEFSSTPLKGDSRFFNAEATIQNTP